MERNDQKKKKTWFDRLFYKDRPEDKPLDDIDSTRGVKNYFKLLKYNFGRIFTVNIYAILGNFPMFFIMFALSENLHIMTTSPTSTLFGPLYGAVSLGAVSPSSASLLGAYGTQTDVAIWTPAAFAFLIAGVVMLLFTFGPVMAGISYNMRNMVKHEPIFMWSDFWYAIKRNLRQSIIIGIFDLVTLFLLGYNTFIYYLSLGTYLNNVLFLANIAMLVLYLFMRQYMYLLLVTFELSIFKIYKNSLIFSVLGFGRNLIATLVCVAFIILNLALMIAYLPLGIIMPFIITVGLCLYTTTYTAWTKIDKIMIEPYLSGDK